MKAFKDGLQFEIFVCERKEEDCSLKGEFFLDLSEVKSW